MIWCGGVSEQQVPYCIQLQALLIEQRQPRRDVVRPGKVKSIGTMSHLDVMLCVAQTGNKGV
jgi:hypothetical protein